MKLRPRQPATFVLAAALTAFAACASLAQPAGEGPALGEGADPSQQIFIMPRSGPFSPETIAIPNARVIASWARSGHSDATSEAFAHWNAEGAIPPNCSVCHSGIGFRSFHGLDGSPIGLPEKPVQIGGVVDCDTCHNSQLNGVTDISLPSGVVHPVTGADASCTTCHQGRAAGVTVTKATDGKEADSVTADLRFINPHYALAASSNLGSYGAGGFEYPGKTYSGRFIHAKPVATCVSCHDPHTLDVAEATCLTCHQTGTPEDIRIARVSYDGSGDTTKGISNDIKANSALLLTYLQRYSGEIAGTPIVYDGHAYPYFFADANGDGLVDQANGQSVAYASWTPRLLQASYNYKYVGADHGIFVHNPPYALELLHDSIADLAEALGEDPGGLDILR